LSPNMEIKALAAAIANHSRLLEAYAFFRRKRLKSQVVILLYHRVAPKEDDWTMEPLSPEDFEKQIAYLCRNFEVVSLTGLIEYLNLEKSLPEKAIAITFDDGYKDNYRYAYPVLKKCHAPATIFLATGYIGGNELFWFDRVRYIIQTTPRTSIELGELGEYHLPTKGERLNAALSIAERLNKVPEERTRLIEKLQVELGVDIPDNLGRELILSWDEVKEMAGNGITFGAHTVNHVIVTNLTESEAKWEIAQSKKAIQENLGQEATVFAYPDGKFNSRAAELVRESGFAAAVTTIPNWITPQANLYELGRIGIGMDLNKFQVAFSGLYSDLDAILGWSKQP